MVYLFIQILRVKFVWLEWVLVFVFKSREAIVGTHGSLVVVNGA